MKITKKKIFGSWLVALAILLGVASADGLVEATSATVETSAYDLQAIFDANEILLNEMTQEMTQLFAQIEGIHQQGGLPPIELPLGIRINTIDLLRGFMNGINIPLLVNIGGIGRLNDALFTQFTYSTILSGSLGFPNGIMNGSNTVNNGRLPAQSLEAQIAAQEYVLYVTDAVRGVLHLVSLMDMNGDDFDIPELIEVMASVRTFLEFNMNDLNQRRNAMYNEFGRETVTLGSFIRVTRNVGDVVRSVDGGGYNLLIDVRNSLLGSQANVNILIEVLDYVERMMNGEILEKYHEIDFTDAHAGVDQVLAYLIADVTEARHILAQFDRLTGPLATLLGQSPEGGIVGLILSFLGDDLNEGIGAMVDDLIASQVPDSLGIGLAHIMHDLLGDIDFNTLSTQDVLVYLDAAIVALEEIRSGVQEINLDQGIRFVTQILSGEILDRYLALRHANGPRKATLLRYIRDDVDGAIAALEVVDLLDQELAPLLGGRYVSDIIKEYLIVTLPHVINNELDSLVTGLGDHGIGEIVTEMFAPVILGFDIPTTIRHLQFVSDTLSYIIPVYERIELLLTQGHAFREGELEALLDHVRGVKQDTISSIRDAIANRRDTNRVSGILQQMRESAAHASRQIDSIRNVSDQIEQDTFDILQQIRERAQEMSQEYREVGRSRIGDFLSRSQLYNYLRRLLRR